MEKKPLKRTIISIMIRAVKVVTIGTTGIYFFQQGAECKTREFGEACIPGPAAV